MHLELGTGRWHSSCGGTANPVAFLTGLLLIIIVVVRTIILAALANARCLGLADNVAVEGEAGEWGEAGEAARAASVGLVSSVAKDQRCRRAVRKCPSANSAWLGVAMAKSVAG